MTTARRQVRAGLVLGALLGLLLPACRSAPPRQPASAEAPIATVSYVLAPVHADGELELEDLAGVRGPAAQLRRAWLHLQLGRAEAAADAAAEVLYGVERPSPTEEAFARYIRAESRSRQGHPELGDYDRERALELALDPELRRRLQPAAPAAAARAGAPLGEMTLEPRLRWRPMATVRSRLDPMERIYRLTVHHSGMLFHDTSPASCAAEIQKIQRNHMLLPDRRYGDIGYHFLIDPAGRVWQGRDLRWQGAHARADNNRGNIGICLLGNFVRGADGQRPTPAQAQALLRLTGQLCSQYHISFDEIHKHRDFVVTECPGPYVESLLAAIVRDLRAGRDGGSNVASHD